ncbi:MAG TPA: hypothetical protein VGR20_07550, partial [Acidimicrobiia bacterium]|nr:hypothetical protein [Acidimicrobiia bacterium]
VGTLIAVGLGGAGLAYAQTTDSTGSSTTTSPAVTQDPSHCKHGAGGGGGGGGSSSGSSTSPTPSTASPGSV